MSELGLTMRRAREDAGLSLSGMAKRTGYSRGYLGNVETGIRQVTPDIIAAYERVLGDDLKRRTILLGGLSAIAATAATDAATSIAHDIASGRSGLLVHAQTSHATDRAVAALVARHLPSVASLVKWSRSGKAVLRVNAAGILAKIQNPVIDNEAVGVLRKDGDVRERYLTAVVSRVLSVPWEDAAGLVHGNGDLPSQDAVEAFVAELTNPHDAGARWCSVVMLSRDRQPVVTEALINAMTAEPSRENLRTIGLVLGGRNPLDT